jgi:hypothetical protein
VEEYEQAIFIRSAKTQFENYAVSSWPLVEFFQMCRELGKWLMTPLANENPASG